MTGRTPIFIGYEYPFSPEFMPMWGVFVLMIGACVGSFLNVCIWRMPRDESVFFPKSHCPNCGRMIRARENIPLLSWIFLRGRCAGCGGKISFRYFMVEFATAVLFFLVWERVTLTGMPLAFAPLFFLVTMLLITTVFIDFEHRIIPNETTYTALVFGLLYSAAFPEVWGGCGRVWALVFSVSSALVAGGAFALLAWLGEAVFKKEALGWGDVKFLAAIGACLGLKACFFTVFFGSLTGSATGLLLMLFGRKKAGLTIPFGPFMAFGTYLWILFSPEIMAAYHIIFDRFRL